MDREQDNQAGAVWKLAGAIVLLVLVISGIALAANWQLSKKYDKVFFPNTIINGVDVSGKNIEQVKGLFTLDVDQYVLVLKEQGGRQEQLEGRDIGLKTVFDGSLERILNSQEKDKWKWFMHLSNQTSYQIETMVDYDQDALAQKIDGLRCLNPENLKKPQDATISEYTPGIGFTVVPQVKGNQVDKEVLSRKIRDAIESLKDNLSLEEEGCYVEPAVKANDEQLNALVENLNQKAKMTVSYQIGEKQEILSGETISQWLTVNQDSSVTIDENKVEEYIKELAAKYDTAYKEKTLKTSYGPTVKISGGHYGWKMNQGAEREALLSILQSGESQTRTPEFTQTAASHGDNDYGDTYVEINLTAQHLFFYKNGRLLVESDFVSGNLSRGWGTPAGAFPLTYKQRNATLKGEGYATPVDYWMPFNGGIGLHDATWRSSFGGTIYKNGGSHGCVNLPHGVAKVIYENIQAGMPVLCYNLEGTESKTTSTGKIPQEPTSPTIPTTPETSASPEESASAGLPTESGQIPDQTPTSPVPTETQTESTSNGIGTIIVPDTSRPSQTPESSPVNPQPETTKPNTQTQEVIGPGGNPETTRSSHEVGPGF